jgi:hypothetical protein
LRLRLQRDAHGVIGDSDCRACWLKITSSASAWPANTISSALKSLA